MAAWLAVGLVIGALPLQTEQTDRTRGAVGIMPLPMRKQSLALKNISRAFGSGLDDMPRSLATGRCILPGLCVMKSGCGAVLARQVEP